MPPGPMLRGKVALVTGATGHLGSSIARALAQHGCDLVLTARRRENLEALRDELAASGRAVHVVAGDLTAAGGPEAVAAAACDAAGTPDIVVSNAVPPADVLRAGDVLSTPDHVWEEMHDVIVWGPMRLLRAIGPRWIERGSGSLITVVSATAFSPSPGYDAYGLAKGSLLLLTKYLAKEWGPHGIRANAISPGAIATHGDVDETIELLARNHTLDRINLQRVGASADVVGAAVYLASDAASFVTGQLLCVDGGRL